MIFFKRSTILFLLPFFVMRGMDYPQLQLEKSKKPIKIVQRFLQLNSLPFFSISSYKTPGIRIHFHGRPPRYLNDPLVHVQLFENNKLREELQIPVKHLFNCDDGSSLQFTIENIHIPSESYFITATCRKNPQIPGKTFHQQWTSIMACFYKSPEIIEDQKVKLLTANVTEEQTTYESGNNDSSFFFSSSTSRKHGKKGCPNEKTFAQLMIKPKTKSYNNSLHQLVMDRQTGTKTKRRPTMTINLNLILDNCFKEMEYDEIAAKKILEDCFNELQAICALTDLLIKNRTIYLLLGLLIKHQLS